MRSSSKAALAWGPLLSFPVKLYAITKSHDTSFKQLHSVCRQPLKQPRYCPVCESRDVPQDQVIKGVEIAKGKYVEFNDAELAALSKSVGQIAIESFLPVASVPLTRREKVMVVGPDTGGRTPYTLLRAVLRKQGKIAVGKHMKGTKEHLVAIEPGPGQEMLLWYLFYADEMQPIEVPDVPAEDEAIKERDLMMAEQIVQMMSSEKSLDEFTDENEHYLAELKAAKAEGKVIEAVAVPEARPLVDMTDLLQQTLEKLRLEEKERKQSAAPQNGGDGAKTPKKEKAKR